jgi:hypothetical protein
MGLLEELYRIKMVWGIKPVILMILQREVGFAHLLPPKASARAAELLCAGIPPESRKYPTQFHRRPAFQRSAIG